MAKSSINILQEYCIRQYKKYPDYQIKDTSSINSPLFTVDCIVGTSTSRGIGLSKIAAKTAATDEMLKKMGITQMNYPTTVNIVQQTSPRRDENYIGMLNEFCSKNAFPYPQYIEQMKGATFVIACVLQGITVMGQGANKKSAKQESARAMWEKCHHISKPTIHDDAITSLIDLGSLSIQDSPQLSQACNNEIQKFVPPKGADSVSIFNLYCEKYKYKKPEYFDCGKDGNLYTTKCIYQRYETKGSGLTTKFAKQDSALQMLEIIGIKQEGSETNNNVTVLASGSSSVLSAPDDKTVMDIFKKTSLIVRNNNLSTTVDDLISFDDDLSNGSEKQSKKTSHPELHSILMKNGVKYDLEIMQNGEPCIVLFRGKRLMPDGNVLEKHLMEMGDKYQDLVGVLLQQAVNYFNCSNI